MNKYIFDRDSVRLILLWEYKKELRDINSKKEDIEMHCTELNKFTLKNLIIKII